MSSQPHLHPDEALRRILSFSTSAPVEEVVELLDAVGRVLPREILSPIDSPPFDKAAMDGYAVRSDDHSKRFRLVETIAAGIPATRELQPGECMKIMTGAQLPAGAGRVIRVEYTELEAGWMCQTQPEPSGNVIFRGENAMAGSALLGPRVLGPADIAALASMGIASVPVARRPRVAVIATGTELRLPGEQIEAGQIYNSNSFSLTAQARRAGAVATNYGTVSDDREVMRQRIGEALADSDVVLLSGGVSMGDFDFVPEVLADCGVDIVFHKVRIKPGKPTLFGRTTNAAIFGLPGNPASTYVLFELFVVPLLHRLMGVEYRPVIHRGELIREVARRIADRVEYLPARITDGEVKPLSYRGSNHINALCDANCLLRMDLDEITIAEGSIVHVRQI